MFYEQMMIYLRFITTYGYDASIMKKSLKFKVYLEWSWATPKAHLLSLKSLSHSRNKKARMHGGMETSEGGGGGGLYRLFYRRQGRIRWIVC